jgi:MoaA/NifB/PqqE/SkfB family radical SAM enzyme
LTVTRQNFNIVTNRDFIKDLIDKGCRLFFFSDYVPVQPGTDELALTEAQQVEEARIVAAFRSEFQGLFVAFPGDEKDLGGCLGAGRGLIHVSAGGNVEPCPAAPFSDVNLQDMPLKDALQSEFLKRVRENHAHRNDTDGCALWKHRDQVASLLNEPA